MDYRYSFLKKKKKEKIVRFYLNNLKIIQVDNHPLRHWAVKNSVERGNNSFIVLLHLDQQAEERSVDQAAMISPSRLLAPQRDLCSGRVQA